ncbi:MAG TPA: sugar phosphate isomerase/epimerase [Candidatus Nitrosopolaris sp.]|nr:sugar phosphate isomerase/epimerase [Candidatus Nitrosopolaris sp.]
MKLGLLTAAFQSQSLEEVADWAAGNGFQALEIACWPAAGAERRRYAGVSHIDVERLDAAAARRVRELLSSRDLTISSLAYYPNPLDPDPAVRSQAQAHLRKVIEAAATLEVNLVCTFIGRDQNQPPEPAFADVLEQWPPLVKFAADRSVRIAIENCPMIFSADEWPGGRNLAYSPGLWRRLFEAMPGETLGLNLDPSHLVWQFIDVLRVVREFGPRIYHVHAKDLEIDRDGLYENGVMSLGMGWQVPRMPGLGEVPWNRFIAALIRAGYDGVVSVEHEDRSFEGDLDLVKRGFLLARNTLRPLLV